MNRERNVDILRGIAMLMVVLQHTIGGSTVNYSHTLLFQVVWTLQLPLFVLISGYVTKFSKPLHTRYELLNFIKKRTIAYLSPLVIWTFLVRGVIFNQYYFFDLNYMIWHMDAGYWFLWMIWVISMIYGLGEFFANKLNKKFDRAERSVAIIIMVFLLSIFTLAVLSYFIGINFLAIKLILYYIPFFVIGLIYSRINHKKIVRKSKNLVIALCLGVWIALIVRYDFLGMEDSIWGIAIRFVASVCGSITICGLVQYWTKYNLFTNFITWAGTYSLEIYLFHYLCLAVIQNTPTPPLYSILGFCITCLNYGLTLSITVIAIKAFQYNVILNRILFSRVLPKTR